MKINDININVIPQTLKIICSLCGEPLDIEMVSDGKFAYYPCSSKDCIANPSKDEQQFLGASAYGCSTGNYAVATEYDVILTEYTDNKIQVLKLIRDITNLNVEDSFKLINSLPQFIATGISKWTADDIKKQFESLGAKIEIKPM